jgi:2'-5' RNA ligase
VISQLEKISYHQFTIRVVGVGGFANLRRPRVVFLDVEESRDIMNLQRIVEDLMARIGFSRETRPFKPHITVARVKSLGSLPVKVYEGLTNTVIDESITVDSIKLKESILTPSGARYKDLFVKKLGGGVGGPGGGSEGG